jgi:hypothetical protein
MQTRPWIRVKETERFMKRADVSGLWKPFAYFNSVFFRKELVQRGFVCFNPEQPVLACLYFRKSAIEPPSAPTSTTTSQTSGACFRASSSAAPIAVISKAVA